MQQAKSPTASPARTNSNASTASTTVINGSTPIAAQLLPLGISSAGSISAAPVVAPPLVRSASDPLHNSSAAPHSTLASTTLIAPDAPTSISRSNSAVAGADTVMLIASSSGRGPSVPSGSAAATPPSGLCRALAVPLYTRLASLATDNKVHVVLVTCVIMAVKVLDDVHPLNKNYSEGEYRCTYSSVSFSSHASVVVGLRRAFSIFHSAERTKRAGACVIGRAQFSIVIH